MLLEPDPALSENPTNLAVQTGSNSLPDNLYSAYFQPSFR